MKNITLLIVFSITVLSCGSDNLSSSKAKKIINECLELKPEQKFNTLMIGEVLISVASKDSKKKIESYKKLANDGYLKVTLTNKKNKIWKEAQFYNVELTEKAKPYIYKPSKMTEKTVYMKSHQYIVDEILEIHETPATNTARVKVKYKLVDTTPFTNLIRTSPKESITKTLKFTKTNDGWKYCDIN